MYKKITSSVALISLFLALGCAGVETTVNSTKSGLTMSSKSYGLAKTSKVTEAARAFRIMKEAERLDRLKVGMKKSEFVGVIINVDLKRTIIVFPPESSGLIELDPGDCYFFETSKIPEFFSVSYPGLERTEKAVVFKMKTVYDGVACDYNARVNF